MAAIADLQLLQFLETDLHLPTAAVAMALKH
jgi:hypothetical protein